MTYMYDIFITHFSVSGHLGCFRVLAVVHSAAMNFGVHASFQTRLFSRDIPDRATFHPVILAADPYPLLLVHNVMCEYLGGAETSWCCFNNHTMDED